MPIEIRAASLSDAPAISRVFAASWRRAYRGQVDQHYLDELGDDHWTNFISGGVRQGTLIIPTAVEGRTIVGAAVARASQIQRFPQDGELACLYLLPDRFGQGVGQRLLAFCEEELRGKGYAHCALDVLDTNERAIRFYQKNGYEMTPHRVKLSLGNGDLQCYLMRKAL